MSNASSSCSRLTLIITVITLVAVVLVSLAAVPSAHASAIANAFVDESIVVTTSAGSISFPPQANFLAVAANSLGETDVDNGEYHGLPVAGAARATWADAKVKVDPLARTGSAASDVNIPSSVAVGHAISQGIYNIFSTTDEPFSIVGTSGPVTVHFSTIVPYGESLLTGSDSGAFAIASAPLQLYGPMGNPIFVLDSFSMHSIGENSSFATSGTLNLDTSETLIAGEEYRLLAQLFTVTEGCVGVESGENGCPVVMPPTPEPASLTLLLAGVLPMLARRRQLWAWRQKYRR